MKEIQGNQPGPSRIWCYKCNIWIKDKYSGKHWISRAHKEGRVLKKTRRGRGKGKKKAKLLQEGVFTKKFLDNQELSKITQDIKKDKATHENVDEVEIIADPASVTDSISVEILSPGLSQSFSESHDIAELELSIQPAGKTADQDRTVRYRNLSSHDEQDAIADNLIEGESEVCIVEDSPDSTKFNDDQDVCLDSIPLPVEYLVTDPSKFQNRDNLIMIEQEDTDAPAHSYDLRSKLSKVPGIDSFSRKLDTFLKEARQQADSAFKSQF